MPRGGGGFNYGAAAVCRFPSLRERGRALLAAALARSSWLLGLDQPVLLHICLDQTKVKPKESIRSAAETPITWLGRLAPLAAGGAGARLPGLRLSAGTDGLLDLPASCPPFPLPGCPPPSPPLAKREKKNLYWYGWKRFSGREWSRFPPRLGGRLKMVINYE